MVLGRQSLGTGFQLISGPWARIPLAPSQLSGSFCVPTLVPTLVQELLADSLWSWGSYR